MLHDRWHESDTDCACAVRTYLATASDDERAALYAAYPGIYHAVNPPATPRQSSHIRGDD